MFSFAAVRNRQSGYISMKSEISTSSPTPETPLVGGNVSNQANYFSPSPNIDDVGRDASVTSHTPSSLNETGSSLGERVKTQSDLIDESEICRRSTSRFSFVRKIPKVSENERQRWKVRDKTMERIVMLHQIDRPSSLLIGRFGFAPASCRSVGITRDHFQEVLLLRCARKCPHVLTCFGFALDKEMHLYVSTEYFDGETLQSFNRRYPKKILSVLQHISRQLLKALNFLHSISIVHNNVVCSSVLLRHNHDDVCTPTSRGSGDYQIKLFNFENANDAGTVSRQRNNYFCEKCHSATRPSSPADDVISFGYLLYENVLESKPWMTSCICDSRYKNFCKRMKDDSVRVNASIGVNTSINEMKNSKKQNPIFFNHKRFSVSAGGMLRPKKKGNAAFQRSWKDLDAKFAMCLSLMLSPSPSSRPTTGELLFNSRFSSLFSSRNDVEWKKRGLSDHLPSTCVSRY